MNSKTKNNIKLIISTLCILIAFICGYVFSKRQNILHYHSKEKIYIDVSTKKDAITIKDTPENIYFRIDGEVIQSGSILLK